MRTSTEKRDDQAPRKSPDGVVTKGMVRIGPYMSLPADLGEHGVEPAPLLAESRLEPAHFLEPEVTISFMNAGLLFARCAEGTNFMRLREEAFHAMSRQLLERTRMPVSEIAGFLGYANPGAFTRAVCRWTGVAPAQWRLANRRDVLERAEAKGAARRRPECLQWRAPGAGAGSAVNSRAGKSAVKKRAARRKGVA